MEIRLNIPTEVLVAFVVGEVFSVTWFTFLSHTKRYWITEIWSNLALAFLLHNKRR